MKNLYVYILIICFAIVSSIELKAQESYQILFWNVENLFFPENDSLTNDDEFTPDGDRHWSFYKYRSKLNLIWKTLYSAGTDGPPEIIGLCEIENRKVLEDLFKYSPLKKYHYQIIHQDSPDSRGIDVALLVMDNLYDTVYSEFIVANYPELNGRPTRDILHTTLVKSDDSLHIFVNHWPSKYGGTGYTDILRVRSAQLLLSEIHKIQVKNPNARIICMGDFNDIPESRAIQLLCAQDRNGKAFLLLEYEDAGMKGSLKYQGRWEFIDHFFVSESLINEKGIFCLAGSNARIYSPSFLLENDEKYGGIKPFRTFIGYRYNGGISDHLPVFIEVKR